ncbi:hypothetical protein BKA80DRAFT_93380 [Phyllosticta citrichinensis]
MAAGESSQLWILACLLACTSTYAAGGYTILISLLVPVNVTTPLAGHGPMQELAPDRGTDSSGSSGWAGGEGTGWQSKRMMCTGITQARFAMIGHQVGRRILPPTHRGAHRLDVVCGKRGHHCRERAVSRSLVGWFNDNRGLLTGHFVFIPASCPPSITDATTSFSEIAMPLIPPFAT